MGEPEGGGKKRKEGIVNGSPSMLKSLILSFAEDRGMDVWPAFTEVEQGPHFFVLSIVAPSDRASAQKVLRSITLQSLPQDRTLIVFESRSLWGPLTETEGEEGFWKFCDALIVRLAQLGFVDVPPPPPKPMGFRTVNSS